MSGGKIPYSAIDFLLTLPHIRLLRAARWFDWIELDDLYIAAEAPDDYADREAYYAAMTRMVKAGNIKRKRMRFSKRGRTRMSTMVRITPKGKKALRAVFDQAVVGCEE